MRPRILSAVLFSVVTLTAATMQPATGAVPGGAMWELDETTGTQAGDSSGNGNHGTLRGAVTVGLTGHQGTAYSFRADGSWVEVPSSVTLNPGADDFGFSAWVNLTRAPGKGVTYDIIRKGLAATPGGEFKLEIISGGRARCTAKDAARSTAGITGPKVNLADARWHHVGCARVGSSWQVIIDGKIRSKAVTLGSISNTKALSIGSKYGNEDGTPGLVDEVRLSIG